MELPEEILTLNNITETKIKVKGSIFLCLSYPVNSFDYTNQILEELKKRYYHATHICYAIQLLNDVFRYSDAGEPSGTAGIRIHNAIQHFNLSNVLVAVIRWFGGVKLGVGPLGKAYYNSALENLSEAKKINQSAYKLIQLNFDFPLLSLVHNCLSLVKTKGIEISYDSGVKISSHIAIQDLNGLMSRLEEKGFGKIKISLEDNLIYL